MKINVSKIKLLLATQELTRSELANRSGISRQSISTILGRETCEPKTAGKIAKALGVDAAEIIKEE